MSLHDVRTQHGLGGWVDRHPTLAGLVVLLAIAAACVMAIPLTIVVMP